MTSEGQRKKPREINELKEKLNGNEIEDKQEAIRGIINYMTQGKDVSSLFMDVLKNITTTSLQLKKLIYLYVMSYAKSHPDLAILGVNTFRKVNHSSFRTPSTKQTPSCVHLQLEPWAAFGSKILLNISAILSSEHSKMRTPMSGKQELFVSLKCIKYLLS